MRKMTLFVACIFLLGCQIQTTEWEENPEIAELFKSMGVNGTFVLYDYSSQRLIGYNQARAETEFVPASTYKIPNTLIGLSVGAVGSVDEVLPYGGEPQPFGAWERDMALREAITLSSVPIYQELARRIGMERMLEYIDRLDYGNKSVGAVVDNFWLEGPLEISAIAQTGFLARLAQGELPISEDIQASVREIVLTEEKDDWKLYSKTGWENAPDPGVGWWVGWVHKGARLYTFALNMDIEQASDASKRVELGRASLKLLLEANEPSLAEGQ